MVLRSEMEPHQIIKLQEMLLDKITKSWRNYKKSPKDRLTIGYIEGRLEALETFWCQFQDNHQHLVAKQEMEELLELPYITNSMDETFEELYYTYRGEMKNMLLILNAKTASPPTTASTSRQAQDVKLPQISIPTFSGNYLEWQSFHDLFVAVIDSNSSLDKVQKLHYLKLSISGEAEVLLRQISVTGDNYEAAWSLLKQRFSNKRYICNSIFNRLFQQKPIHADSAHLFKELLDTTVECLNSLKNLGLPTDKWDAIIIHLVVSKLDSQSHRLWEESVNADGLEQLPSFSSLKMFLENRFRILEMIEPAHKGKSYNNKAKNFHMTISTQCPYCQEKHYLYTCKEFAKLSPENRQEFVKGKHLCFNCFGSNHGVYVCKSTTLCRICNRKHHSLLHLYKKYDVNTHNLEGNHPINKDENVLSNFMKKNQPGQGVLLSTVLVNVKGKNDHYQIYRALIDSGSQASFVTQTLVQHLGLKKLPIHGVVTGIGEGTSKLITKHMVIFNIQSRYDANFIIEVQAYVLKSLTTLLPTRQSFISNWPEVEKLPLADPQYGLPKGVDLLLGAEVNAKILLNGLIKNKYGAIAQNTHLGWMISGETESPETSNRHLCFHTQINLNDELKRFWELEEVSITRQYTEEEVECEKFYNNTVSRSEKGQYVVKLPFKKDITNPIEKCGNTLVKATSRLQQLENRFLKDQKFKSEYSKVIAEHLRLGFMKESTNLTDGIYLPHHAVVRADRDTTKVRVVYDAACPGSNGYSLNDTLMIGPTLQKDLRSLLLIWRTYKICLISDITKMYLMVRISPEDTKYQKIIWRDELDNKVKHYELLTVTFGTSSAPYLAVRSLLQLAADEGVRYPRAAEIVKTSFYMDDLITGGESAKEVVEIHNELKEMLKLGGFQLQKWSSNSDEVLSCISNESEISTNPFEIKLDSIIKILGLTWDRKSDKFSITVNLPNPKEHFTKRNILSDIARLFDPFGWLAPTVIIAKMLIQKLWLCNVDWDEVLPNAINREWEEYRSNLCMLQGIQINRWLNTVSSSDIELHGFADASALAYAAVVYCRVVDKSGVNVNIVAAKTKVAPVKQVSIPRLELCAAVLLARLVKDVSAELKVPTKKIFAWSDSQIVLSWLQGHPIKWKIFVANRVTEILGVIDSERWNHVKSEENPADLASRGVSPTDLSSQKIWWEGPEWLKYKEIPIKKYIIKNTNLEMRTNLPINIFNTEIAEPVYNKYSVLKRAVRVVAYLRRFLKLLKSNKQNEIKNIYLSTEELNNALIACIKICQSTEFSMELKDLRSNGSVQKRSVINNLSPFLDENGLIRVGGRLQGAEVSSEFQHPIILPNKNHLTKLIILDAHIKTLHGGQLLTMNVLRSRYWILGLRTMVKGCIHSCVICIRQRASIKSQFMGQLPCSRINPSRPFLRTGVDYAGPLQIRSSKGRGHHSSKGYICVFVCMATKAVHLEAVSDLTTQGFLAAFKRFVSRRGHCSDIWSDNATNFVGASVELQVMHKSSVRYHLDEIAELLAQDGTNWHNIPPEAPNHGGLWEAAVRSTKAHLKRVIGQVTLTFEEMSTLLAQIEACLNSRPLSQDTTSPDDLRPLTPGHFLIGEPIITIPDKNYEDHKLHNITRWQLVQRMTQHFWRRWHQEYLHTMQQRYKWSTHEQDLKPGNVVIIKESNLPPTKWLLGKIQEVHPGPDQHVRVVTLITKGGTQLKRPISKLVYLPIE